VVCDTYHTEAVIIDLSGQFKMNTAEDRSLFLVDTHRRGDLLDNVHKVTSL
jgi:hypothetical protein